MEEFRITNIKNLRSILTNRSVRIFQHWFISQFLKEIGLTLDTTGILVYGDFDFERPYKSPSDPMPENMIPFLIRNIKTYLKTYNDTSLLEILNSINLILEKYDQRSTHSKSFNS